MSTTELKEKLHQRIEEADESLLKIMHAMVEAYVAEQEDPIVGYDIHGNPKRAGMMKEQLRQEVERAEKGEYITVEELRKKSDEWLKRTK